MDTFLVTIKNGKEDFGSEYNLARYHDWKKANEGAQLEIKKKKKPVSKDMRGYYFGAILPTVRKAIPQWEKLSDEEIHEILKKQFCYFDAFNALTKRIERFSRTVMSDESSTIRAMDFIESIRVWLAEDYKIELPDPEEYKHKRDIAPMIEE